jgi:inward rectifier potassium channel
MSVQGKVRKEITRGRGGYEIHVLGAPRTPLRDLYQTLLRVPWWAALSTIVGGYLALNSIFALGYLAVGGVTGVPPGSFEDAFYFSVQTMGTIGYGVMAPASRGAHLMVVCESVTGLIVIALATGLVFVRVSRTRARLMFSRPATIGVMDGKPTVMLRVGTERKTPIVDALFRLTVVRTTTTAEGSMIYRSTELPLVRERATALSRSWMILHEIRPDGPLGKDTPDTFAAGEVELTLTVSGVDDTSGQQVHANYTWYAREIVWGARLADVLSDEPDRMVLDLRKFHDVEATPATATFPYSLGVDQGRNAGTTALSGSAPVG